MSSVKIKSYLFNYLYSKTDGIDIVDLAQLIKIFIQFFYVYNGSSSCARQDHMELSGNELNQRKLLVKNIIGKLFFIL